jgi:hypothetical protein
LLLAIIAVLGAAERAPGQEFPRDLVEFVPLADAPVFTGAGPGHWDVKIRERGWILRDSDGWHLWYTGYDGTRTGIRRLGYATSADGMVWKRHAANPLLPDHWVEDMTVVFHRGVYYMFAEGVRDEAQLLTSTDRVQWTVRGKLQIRQTNGQPISPGPYGTPTVLLEDGVWRLLYERADRGVWLATSKDLPHFQLVQDEPVMVPGPAEFENQMIAFNQVVKRDGRYYAYYHGRGAPPNWSSCIARSDDLIHWTKYSGNPLFPTSSNQSSGFLAPGGEGRFYTMHDAVRAYGPRK